MRKKGKIKIIKIKLKFYAVCSWMVIVLRTTFCSTDYQYRHFWLDDEYK